MSSFIIEADDFTLECYRHIMQCLLHHTHSTRIDLLYSIIITASFNPQSAEALCGIICGVSALNDNGFLVCQDFFDLHHRNEHLAFSRLNIWLRMSCFDAATKQVLADLARILNIRSSDGNDLPLHCVEAARGYYQGKVTKMVETAQRLEVLKKAMKKVSKVVGNMLARSVLPGKFKLERNSLPYPVSTFPSEIRSDMPPRRN